MATPASRPTVDQVARLIRTRTNDSSMNEVGTFDEATRPTADQVEEYIDDAMALVGLRVPLAQLPTGSEASYAAVVALQAAAVIEKSYWPEQIDSGRSSYAQLVAELQAGVAALEGFVYSNGATPGGDGAARMGEVMLGSWTGGGCTPCPPS